MINLITNELIKQITRPRMGISLGIIVLIDSIASLFVYLLFDGAQFSFWEYMRISSNLLIVIQIFCLIIAGDIVSSEFSTGTIKLLLIRPISRVNILLSKYITILVIAMVLTAAHFLFSVILGSLWFYDSFFDFNVNFFIVAGAYVLRFIELIVICSIAFTFSVLTRSSSFAIGSTIFLTFSAGTFLILMNERGLEWGRYLFFANTDLQQYFFGTPPFEGMTFWFSVVVILVYLVGFGGLAWWSFGRRDVEV
ncbi:ABC transporter permease [Rossellomorea arthrocnemi]|jgi:ABC-2 type transport system permease protein|uniref:ABC transporter permease n=1 Tax=Rossellomorea arthrocnemi TaxID=2769542 RepID=UPI0019187639|nr:ABC transporter permease subunit [Rossellomorea arthrocnemi]